jgi:hypothetical protein
MFTTLRAEELTLKSLSCFFTERINSSSSLIPDRTAELRASASRPSSTKLAASFFPVDFAHSFEKQKFFF